MAGSDFIVVSFDLRSDGCGNRPGAQTDRPGDVPAGGGHAWRRTPPADFRSLVIRDPDQRAIRGPGRFIPSARIRVALAECSGPSPGLGVLGHPDERSGRGRPRVRQPAQREPRGPGRVETTHLLAGVTPLVQTKFDEGSPKFSPDGKWLAYCSNESGRPEVYVTPYPGPGARIQVSVDGGFDPVWRRKGGELYYRQNDSMMVVSVATQPKLTLSKPRVLWERHYRQGTSVSCGGVGATTTNYDVTADGERFVMIQDKTEEMGARQVNVVLGWAEELKRAAQARN